MGPLTLCSKTQDSQIIWILCPTLWVMNLIMHVELNVSFHFFLHRPSLRFHNNVNSRRRRNVSFRDSLGAPQRRICWILKCRARSSISIILKLTTCVCCGGDGGKSRNSELENASVLTRSAHMWGKVEYRASMWLVVSVRGEQTHKKKYKFSDEISRLSIYCHRKKEKRDSPCLSHSILWHFFSLSLAFSYINFTCLFFRRSSICHLPPHQGEYLSLCHVNWNLFSWSSFENVFFFTSLSASN